MTQTLEIFPGITRLAKLFEGILLDAYGVFWGGNAHGLLPGSKEAMEALVSKGKVVGILSNSTQLAAKEMHKLAQHGILQGTHFHFFTSSGEAARDIFLNEKLPFATPRKKFWLFGGVHPRFSSHEAIFQDSCYSETTALDEADFIYIAIPHIQGEDQVDPELFREEVEKLKRSNLPMVCPNPDRFAHEGKPPRAVVRQGSIASMYEKMGGYVFYVGKPHNVAYMLAMHHFQKYNLTDPASILMVGDTPETDIRGARSFGMPSALITQTGMMADRISHHGLDQALKALPAGDLPNYFLKRLIDDDL